MLLTKLSRYARRRHLMDDVDLTRRNVAFTINIDADGNIDVETPVSPLTSGDGKKKSQSMLCPSFPGEKNGGKADFLFETPGRVLGTETGEIARKTHESFWMLVKEAHEVTGDFRLGAVLNSREKLGSIRTLFKPDDTALVTFAMEGEPVFDPDGAVRRWHRSRYLSLTMPHDDDKPPSRGMCLVNAKEESIATSHPVIKGVPGTMAKGGRLISYEKSDVTLNCFGRSGNEASPIGQEAAAEIGAALNSLIGDPRLRLILGDSKSGGVFISWLDENDEAAASIMSIIERPMDDDAMTLINEFREGRFRDVSLSEVYHGCVLAGNVSRISAIRELDQPVMQIIANLARWREDIAIDAFPSKKEIRIDLSLRHLADVVTTARKSGDKPDPQMLANNMQELLFAMLDGTYPRNVLCSLINQIQNRIIKNGKDWFYSPQSHSAFSLMRMILNRKEGTPMPVGLDVSSTDTSYVCGRLFAIFCRIQKAAQGDLNRDFASSSLRAVMDNPQEYLPRIWEQAEYYLSKLQKGLSYTLATELHAVTDQLGAEGFPAEFTEAQQGRFLLGFRHQSAEQGRAAQERAAAKKASSDGE